MIIAFLSLLFLLPGCRKRKHKVSLMQMSLIVLVGHTLEKGLLLQNVNCEAEGIFTIRKNRVE